MTLTASSTVPSSSLSSSPTTRGQQPVKGKAKKGKVKRRKQQTPQQIIDEFWAKFTTKTPGRATFVIPQNGHTAACVATDEPVQAKDPDAEPSTSPTKYASYEAAAAMCRAKVDKIVREGRRVNKKYRDPHFDLQTDLKRCRRDCLESLSNDVGDSGRGRRRRLPGVDLKPRSAKRVGEIFDRPEFYIDGPTANDVRQGRDGDCWLMAALCTLSNKQGLIQRLCVAHDQGVGVYGFVFHRDGEWFSEIVDDFLYLTKPDYDEGFLERVLFDELERTNPEEAYRKINQTNSTALYFAQCQHPRETWLPLLEKAYAKAHGDYAAIEGGFAGEGIEDLTGGVTSELYTSDILDKEYFWNEELLKVNETFLFGCSTGVWGETWGDRKGIVERHAYSIQRAVEIQGKRLLKLKNPWGKGEWKGAWSDGSKEWTAEWLQKLDHRFGDDGDFWITYDDLLRKYQAFERTRLFGDDWQMSQIWTTLSVPWAADYHDTYFSFTLLKPGPVVLVLAQLDDRYFCGLEGPYSFKLAFRLHKDGAEDYIVRTEKAHRLRRSVNVELDLEKGDYQVRVKIDATRYDGTSPIHEVVRDNANTRREKLTRVGLAYNLAHSKGRVVETREEKAAREAYEAKLREKEKQGIKDSILAEREEVHYLKVKHFQKYKRRHVRRKEKATARTGANDRSERVPEENRASGGDDTQNQQSSGVLSGKSGAAGNEPLHSCTRYGCVSGTDDELSSVGSLSDLSERELDIQAEARLRNQMFLASNNTNSLSPTTWPDEDSDDESDPWNAVVVVGLRVYHQVADGDRNEDIVIMRVIRPNSFTGDELKPGSTPLMDRDTQGLDIDDIAKDATIEGDIS